MLPETHLKALGSLGDTSQYKLLEEPFWTRQLAADSNGRITAELVPFDRTGLRGAEAIQLTRLGVISFLTVPLSQVASEDLEANAMDLPGMSPTLGQLRRVTDAYRPVLVDLYRERYGIELLAMFSYPAQVVSCAEKFTGLRGLAGRRVRTSSAVQTNFVEALGGIGVNIPFVGILSAVEKGVVDCVITGTLTGNSIGLYRVMHYIEALPINWGVQMVAANSAAWEALDPEVRSFLRDELRGYEERAWRVAADATEDGFDCNTGRPSCKTGEKGTMVLVPPSAEDEALRRQILASTILPKWAERCGPECAFQWNRSVGVLLGLTASFGE
jgi:TRAP-type C4-dicarboxylate transport system substrate-binding protein